MDNNYISQLHKTDYNNFADLSYFVGQYELASKMIDDCNKFYISFLDSKLWNFRKFTDYEYLYKFNMYTLGGSKTIYKDVEHSYGHISKEVVGVTRNTYFTHLYITKFYDFVNRYVNDELADKYGTEHKLKRLNIDKLQQLVNSYKEAKQKQCETKLWVANKIVNEVPSEFLNKLYKHECKYTLHDIRLEGITENTYFYYLHPFTDNYYDNDNGLKRFIREYGEEYKDIFFKFKPLVDEASKHDEKCSYDVMEEIEWNRHKLCIDIREEFLKKLENLGIEIYELFRPYERTTCLRFTIDESLTDEENFIKFESIIIWAQNTIKKYDLYEFLPSVNYIINENNVEEFCDNLTDVKIQLSSNHRELLCTVDYLYNVNKYHTTFGRNIPQVQHSINRIAVFNVDTNELVNFESKHTTRDIDIKEH